MRLKSNVRLTNIVPEMVFANQIVEYVYEKFAQWTQVDSQECVCTSGNDSKHGINSLHSHDGKCRALDYRTNNVANPSQLKDEIKFRLGQEFDVLFEGAGTPNQHLHVEFDPK